MKNYGAFILIMFMLYGSAVGQALTNVMEIRTANLDTKDFLDTGNDRFVKYINENLEINKMFRLKVLGASAADTVSVEREPDSPAHRVSIVSKKIPFTEMDFDIVLSDQEEVEYQITINMVSDNKFFIYKISLSTERQFRPNCNYIFLSAIRSVAGIPQNNEFFDLNLKFSYLKTRTMFTLFGLDLSLAPADSGQLRITEGLITVNWFPFDNGIKLSSGELKRAFFVGAGAKIFNQVPYVGGHVGSIEINGPLLSSYVMIGYYFNAYGRYAITPSEEDPVNFRNNIYSEFTLAFDNKKNIAGILSDIRIKLGMMFPFTSSENDIVKPIGKDIQYRLVLEVPIGGIFKF